MGSPLGSNGGGGGGGGMVGILLLFLRRGIMPMVCPHSILGFNVRRMCDCIALFTGVLSPPNLLVAKT